MKKILILSSFSFLLQACTAIPAPSEDNRRDYREENADRFSVKDIKQSREQEYAQKLAVLNRKNPVIEAQRAAAADNYYLLAYHSGRGGSLKIPGLTQQQSEATRCNLKQLDALGDMIYGTNHLQYRVAIRKYANQFNKTMIRFCR